MCLANHPVLYAVHLQGLERACVRATRPMEQPLVEAEPERASENHPVRDYDSAFARPIVAFLERFVAVVGTKRETV